MTPQEINIAIAQACGWGRPYQNGVPYRPITNAPNYHASLDAMHEAWKAAIHPDPMRALEFYRILTRLVETKPDRSHKFGVCLYDEVTNATAAQRAEAFLRTLGKWKE
jgi:hypothetical protein